MFNEVGAKKNEALYTGWLICIDQEKDKVLTMEEAEERV